MTNTEQATGNVTPGREAVDLETKRQALARYVTSAAGAGAVTFMLGAVMALMIKTDFTAADKFETHTFEVNPVAEEIAPPERRARDTLVKDVIVPPPAPHIETASKTLPSEPIVAMGGNPDIVWDIERIEPVSSTIKIADSEETPLYRTEPVMPLRAQKSGHCFMAFDVSAEGAPYNITAQSCSQNLFARASIKAVGKWKYKAKVVGGQRVSRAGLTMRLTFNLSDERGRLIPE